MVGACYLDGVPYYTVYAGLQTLWLDRIRDYFTFMVYIGLITRWVHGLIAFLSRRGTLSTAVNDHIKSLNWGHRVQLKKKSVQTLYSSS